MSDIIPFQSKQKLYHNILNAQQQNKYKKCINCLIYMKPHSS